MKVKSRIKIQNFYMIFSIMLMIFATSFITCILHNEEIVNRKISTSTSTTTSTSNNLDTGNQIVDEFNDSNNNVKKHDTDINKQEINEDINKPPVVETITSNDEKEKTNDQLEVNKPIEITKEESVEESKQKETILVVNQQESTSNTVTQ